MTSASHVAVPPLPELQPLVRDVPLRDGATLRLQAPTPADLDDIKAFYDGLSPESRYLHFHGFVRTDAVARTDAEATGADRLALIGRHDGRVVAVASYAGLREPGVAEVAFAVADDEQHRGIGMRMLEAISAASAGQPKPVVASVLGSDGRLPAGTALGVPNFLSPSRAPAPNRACPDVVTRPGPSSIGCARRGPGSSCGRRCAIPIGLSRECPQPKEACD